MAYQYIMNIPPKNTRPFKADSPLRVVKPTAVATAIDTPEAISDRMIRIEAAHKILQHFTSSDQLRDHPKSNMTFYSSRLEIPETEYGSPATQDVCTKSKDAVPSGCRVKLDPAIPANNGLRLFDGSPGRGDHDVPEEKTEQVSSKYVAKNDDKKNHELMNRYTTFYKNPTGDFFWKLQEAERLLYKKIHLISKIDFPAQKRRMLDREVAESGEPETLADVLSDPGMKYVVEQPKSRAKQTENKLVVEVETFVESFSKMKTPEYRNHLKNESWKKTPLPYEKLFDKIHPKVDAKCNTSTTVHARPGEPLQDGEWHYVSAFPEGIDMDTKVETDSNPVGSETETSSSSEDATLRPVSAVPGDAIYSIQSKIPEPESVTPALQRADVSLANSRDEAINKDFLKQNIGSVEQKKPKKNAAGSDATENNSTVTGKCSLADKGAPSVVFSATDSSPFEPLVASPLEKTNANEPERSSDIVTQVTTHSIVAEVNDMQKTEDAPEKKPASKVVFPTIIQRLEKLAPKQYDMLAEHIKNKVYDGNRLIAFCGMKRQVGCSTMALAAAQGMSRHGLKTIVVDANFEFPMLGTLSTSGLSTSTSESDGMGEGQNRLNPSETPCWVEVLLGKADWETIGFSPDDRHLLTILPLSENALTSWSHVEPEELQQKTNRLIADLHEHFDLVLLDCGSFDPEYEEITWGELELFQPDGVVLVRNPKTVPPEKMEPYRRNLRACGMEEFGVAENFA